MKPSLTDALCTQCGLCCDGTLFADVELASGDEATALEAMGLEIEDDENGRELLIQPCGALRRTRCSVYEHRPECCRAFECKLLQDARRGVVTVKQAKQHIAEALRHAARVRELAAQLGQRDEGMPLKERCIEALALIAEAGADPVQNRIAREMEAAMEIVEKLIRERFLGRKIPR